MKTDTATTERLEELRRPQTLENQIERLFDEGLETYGFDNEASKNRIHTNHATAIFRYIQTHLFKPSQADPNQTPVNGGSILLYGDNNDLLLRAVYAYMDICARWDILPTLNGFSALTGINKQTFYNWSNGVSNNGEMLSGKRVDFAKIIREASQGAIIGALYADTVGRVTLANNERSIGLNYTAQNALIAGEVQRAISSDELPRLDLLDD